MKYITPKGCRTGSLFYCLIIKSNHNIFAIWSITIPLRQINPHRLFAATNRNTYHFSTPAVSASADASYWYIGTSSHWYISLFSLLSGLWWKFIKTNKIDLLLRLKLCYLLGTSIPWILHFRYRSGDRGGVWSQRLHDNSKPGYFQENKIWDWGCLTK